ncbi:hypothetical protein HELRODRAFT_163523 [Helobdella robusta]|uniref:L antigen family member 3 n=1 Tax=Helobdella robusta TaxID=6412 RepID=T1EU60_HELRO|nr:hypothetical protein HELRODRAFT_163523 [Helobdella robusta]ESN96460.1 hypothetical protein HELRODRAFT_163523 [Helobdella robusta]
MTSPAEQGSLTMNFELTLPNERHAQIVHNSLRIDKEPSKNKIERTLNVEGPKLIVSWKAKDSRSLRVSVNGFLELLSLVLDTIGDFDLQLTNTTNYAYDVYGVLNFLTAFEPSHRAKPIRGSMKPRLKAEKREVLSGGRLLELANFQKLGKKFTVLNNLRF